MTGRLRAWPAPFAFLWTGCDDSAPGRGRSDHSGRARVISVILPTWRALLPRRLLSEGALLCDRLTMIERRVVGPVFGRPLRGALVASQSGTSGRWGRGLLPRFSTQVLLGLLMVLLLGPGLGFTGLLLWRYA